MIDANSADSPKAAAEPVLMMKIGSYQLQNLLQQRTRFIFLDLRTGDIDRRHALLQESVVVDESQAVGHVRENSPSQDFPIVLVCEDGIRSLQVALALGGAGFSNLFIVRDGFNAL